MEKSLDQRFHENYVSFLESMTETIKEISEEKISITFDRGLSLEHYFHEIKNGGYYYPSPHYEEVQISSADVRISLKDNCSFYLHLNLGKIKDNQQFYETLCKKAKSKTLSLTISDQDYQNRSTPFQELKTD